MMAPVWKKSQTGRFATVRTKKRPVVIGETWGAVIFHVFFSGQGKHFGPQTLLGRTLKRLGELKQPKQPSKTHIEQQFL